MSPTKPVNGIKRSASSAASPSANATKTDGTAPKRQKRDGIAAAKDHAATPTPAAAAAAAASQDFGAHLMTQLTYAVEFLKTKRSSKTLQELLDHLTLQHLPERQQQSFSKFLQRHSRILFKPAPKNKDQNLPAWRTGTYEFKAKLPGVKTKDTLLEHLQQKRDASCTPIKDIKDGWPDCDKAIDELEAAHKILAVRTKKDNHPRYVWLDNPELHHEIDDEFRALWFRQKLPSADEMPRLLSQLGQKATSVPTNDANRNLKAPAKKKKKARQTNRFENKHMAGIFDAFDK
ncbi:transcription initiation factor IIE, beta subunit [Hypoxylon fuscum]|nr:transcription initiation factor IIE, beta subunit [Hypoxylon fuscum]